jgi:hypothetical protein
MSEDQKQPSADVDDAALEREILQQRKFSLEEAIARRAGRDLMKGASPVTAKRQAELAIERHLEQHLIDAEGALRLVLLRRVRESELLLRQGYQQPLAVLVQYLEETVNSQGRLEAFVNEVDAEWGRMYAERPHFQKSDAPPDAEDPYTFASVRAKLTGLLEELREK